MDLDSLYRWFSGGAVQYRTLFHCMRQDMLWIAITVLLDLAVATGYTLIAIHWWTNERRLAESPAKTALRSMKNIFVLCGICGYLFIPVKMYWPAWRLYDMVMLVLVFYTWRYALGSRDLRVVYNELGRSAQLAEDLDKSRAESERKSFFLNAISHDLRTPLNGLMLQMNLAEMLLEAEDTRALRDSFAEIKASARATGDLLNHFLELGRLDWSSDTLHATTFELKDLAEQVVRGCKVLAEQKDLDLSLDVPAGLAVHSDRNKLERVVLNLVHNAIKFTREGGVRIVATARGSGVSVGVEDTGEGIPPEHLGRLFEEFYQVHNRERDRTKGFGLGLAIARRLARQLGGDLAVESTFGRGSRFTIELPGAVAGAARHPADSLSRLAGPRPEIAAPAGGRG